MTIRVGHEPRRGLRDVQRRFQEVGGDRDDIAERDVVHPIKGWEVVSGHEFEEPFVGLANVAVELRTLADRVARVRFALDK